MSSLWHSICSGWTPRLYLLYFVALCRRLLVWTYELKCLNRPVFLECTYLLLTIGCFLLLLIFLLYFSSHWVMLWRVERVLMCLCDCLWSVWLLLLALNITSYTSFDFVIGLHMSIYHKPFAWWRPTVRLKLVNYNSVCRFLPVYSVPALNIHVCTQSPHGRLHYSHH